MKIQDIKITGWYWWRWDEFRYWEPIYVKIINGIPQVLKLEYSQKTYSNGEFFGPIDGPSFGKVGPCGGGVLTR